MLIKLTLSASSSSKWLRPVLSQSKCGSICSIRSVQTNTTSSFEIEEEFEKIEVLPPKANYFQERRSSRIFGRPTKPRSDRMSTDQDWSNVWPGQRMFHPATVPLPLYQGYVKTTSGMKPMPDRHCNVELMKIPNFLHLTPSAIAKQTNALKRFCNEWPKGLETDEDCERHFPMEVYTTDRFYSSPSIRNVDARKVQIQFKLSRLELDEHARHKIILLLGDRYNPKTDLVTIQTDSCPFKKQNLDYALYQLTACFFESWKTEPWEVEVTEEQKQVSQ